MRKRKSMAQVLIGLLLVAALVLIPMACKAPEEAPPAAPPEEVAPPVAPPEEVAPPEKPPVKIGMPIPLSGEGAFFGDGEIVAAEIARDKINGAGGILGGRMIELISYDIQFSPELAVSAVNRLIYEDEVDAIIGFIDNTPLFGAIDLIKDAGILHAVDCCHWKLPSPEYKVIHPYMRPGLTYPALLEYMLEVHPDAKTIGFAGPDVAWSKICYDGLTNAIEKGAPEIELAPWVRFPMFTPDASPYVAELLSYNPDIIHVSTWDIAGLGREITALKEQGFDVANRHFGSSCAVCPFAKLIDALGEDVEGVRGTHYYAPAYRWNDTTVDFNWPAEWQGKGPANAQNKAYVEEFLRIAGYVPELLQSGPYDELMYVAQVFDYVGSTDASIDEYIAALPHVDYVPLCGGGGVTITELGQVVYSNLPIVRVIDGMCTIVAMPELNAEDILSPEEYARFFVE